MDRLAAVVGGGITGIVSALLLRNLGYDVELYESRNELGGTLLDQQGDGGNFYNNCQYLNSHADWMHLLEGCSIEEFAHKYGSYIDIWGQKTVRNDFAGPVYDGTDIHLKGTEKYEKTMSGRISAYPEPISHELLPWSARFGCNPDEIYADSIVGLQLSRIFTSNLIQEVTDLKANNKIADELYGLPRNKLGLQSLKAALPTNGYRALFAEITSLLQASDINVYLKHVVKPQWDGLQLKLIARNRSIDDADVVVWAASPTVLIKNFNGIKLDSPACKMRILWANLLDCHEQIAPFYIQTYSKTMPVTRVFVYNISGVNKISVEAFADDCSSEDIFAWSIDILKKFNIFASIDQASVGGALQKRYILYSPKDFQTIAQFVKETHDSNLVHGGWHFYGRDAKIDAIWEQLKVSTS